MIIDRSAGARRTVWRLAVSVAAVIATVAGCGRSRSERFAGFSEPEEPAAAAAAPKSPVTDSERQDRLKEHVRSTGLLKMVGAGAGAPAADEPAPEESLTGRQTGATTAAYRSGKRKRGKEEAPPPDEEEAAPTRSWFPETFLFAPLVETDDAGTARISVRVPDRLTTWRVLALAHSRAGAQAGAETSFQGTLAAYVDPVVPPFLMAGDEVTLPIQVVNTTEDALTAALRVDVEGATLARAPGTMRVAARGTEVAYAPIRAGRPGQIKLRASIGAADAVERTIPVLAVGRRVTVTRGGTLAAPRTLEIALPADVAADSATARLLVFPGALAILRSELGGAGARRDLAGDAYALLLAGRGEAFLRSLGGEVDGKQLRELGIVAGQRVIRAARSPDTVTAALLTEAALAHPASPVLARLGERLAATVAAGQRPDGTFAGGDGWTLQRLLVTTADCLRAVRAAAPAAKAATAAPGDAAARRRAVRATLAARAAFERNMGRVDDAYTAAEILASGAFDDGGAVREQLRKRVREALRQDTDGSRFLPVGTGVVRSDGAPPSEIEASALAVLALREDPAAGALLSDLGARLLSAYDPARGFGDGRTNLAALGAVLSLFKQPPPPRVTIRFLADGVPVGEQALEGAKLRDVAALNLPLAGAAGKHVYEIRAEPAVPGLGYALALTGYAPWPHAPGAEEGLELSVDAPRQARVGAPAVVELRAAAPAGLDLTIRHGLPAGVQLDTASLEALVKDGTIRSYRGEDGAVTIEVPARIAGQSFNARYRVIPTLAGTLTAPPSSISAAGHKQEIAPARWVVR